MRGKVTLFNLRQRIFNRPRVESTGLALGEKVSV